MTEADMASDLLYESPAEPHPEDGERKVAQKRWRLLARALTRSLNFFEDEVLGGSEEISARRFTSFDLLRQVHLENEDECTWWLYTGLLDGDLYEVLVRRISKCFTANELIGFNNTGNVCVWPSEECLAYYLLKVSQWHQHPSRTRCFFFFFFFLEVTASPIIIHQRIPWHEGVALRQLLNARFPDCPISTGTLFSIRHSEIYDSSPIGLTSAT
jgi:hypothetical protein